MKLLLFSLGALLGSLLMPFLLEHLTREPVRVDVEEMMSDRSMDA